MSSTTKKDRDILMAKRRNKVWELMKGGNDYRSIVRKLESGGISTSISTVSRDVRFILDQLHERTITDAADFRSVELGRLEKMIEILWPMVLTGDIDAMNQVLKISARKAKLFGLDSPELININAKTDSTQTLKVVTDDNEAGKLGLIRKKFIEMSAGIDGTYENKNTDNL